jgi:uncharacterized protein DUF4013
MTQARRIDLRTPLSLKSAFAFPLQTREARREVLIGAALLLLPGLGWLLNMGHRIQMVHNMQAGRSPWPAWRDYARLLKYGTVTFLGMVEYYLPAIVVGFLAGWKGSTALLVAAALLGVGATVAIPGYMSHYCRRFDAREVFHPARALRRVRQGGRAYWRAWGITLAALAVSFVGLIGLGVGFLVTSVWFWQVAGYSFGTVFSQRFDLFEKTPDLRQ